LYAGDRVVSTADTNALATTIALLPPSAAIASVAALTCCHGAQL
jgi:hypothetical protein